MSGRAGGGCCCLPLASSGNEPSVRTNYYCAPLNLFLFSSLVPESAPPPPRPQPLYSPSVSEEIDCPLTVHVIVNNRVSAAISPAPLWDKRRPLTSLKNKQTKKNHSLHHIETISMAMRHPVQIFLRYEFH